ncbi:hypothetical protein CPC08DRAFT_624866 [Agrocybe pediades]|nr:hypothetical protein CPC08DRAFT_624866 [Agrocybe pediades]
MDPLTAPRPSAGYNRNSFFPAAREEPLKGGRDEEANEVGDAWDVYADFNNAGPRYSSAFGMPGQGQAEYSKLPPTPLMQEESISDNKVEMVTVPALGPEWGKEELRQATKAGRREKKAESRKQFWKEWNRGERGLCGRYFTRKVFVWTAFGFCAAIGVVLAFVIPRVPTFSFNADHPLVNATGSWATAIPTQFSPGDANFTFPAMASLQVDTNSNFLPLKFNKLSAQVFDTDTGRQVASGTYAKISFPAKTFTPILLPLNFTYFATNSSDQTYQNWYLGCRNRGLNTDGKRPAVKFSIFIEMLIKGLPNKSSTSFATSGDCPVELPLTAA